MINLAAQFYIKYHFYPTNFLTYHSRPSFVDDLTNNHVLLIIIREVFLCDNVSKKIINNVFLKYFVLLCILL